MNILRFRCIVLVGLIYSAGVAFAGSLVMDETSDTIVVRSGDAPVLTYQKAVLAPPEGSDDLFRRSGFIHPLHAPGGGVVTSIHAPDHIHHLGLWHAWVHTEFRGRPVDFWNLKDGTGLVRYAGSRDLHQSDSSVGFTVRQEQVASAHEGRAEEVVLAETLTVNVSQDAGAYVIDYDIRQRNVTDAPLLFPAYRYGGGIAYRAPLAWEEGNAEYLTSEGLDRRKGHATRGRWVAMYGPTESGDATVVIMGHSSNHDAPQRMRIWPEGKVFFNYVPAQEFDWKIDAGEEIEMRYRVVVMDGRPDPGAIETRWQTYVSE